MDERKVMPVSGERASFGDIENGKAFENDLWGSEADEYLLES